MLDHGRRGFYRQLEVHRQSRKASVKSTYRKQRKKHSLNHQTKCTRVKYDVIKDALRFSQHLKILNKLYISIGVTTMWQLSS